ncbi:MAG: poly(R)-hydroxyalkanoic acid synthase subunit PhaE [Gammaproteobacteria bacterium]
MNKDKDSNAKTDFTDWYSLWLKQSRAFYESANQNLQGMFDKNAHVNPEEHAEKIQEWFESMKKQWDVGALPQDQKIFAEYWQDVAKTCNEACDMLLQEWIKRSKQNDPVKSIKELYEMWLNCCQNIYQQSLQNHSYQEAYGNFMNAAMKFWKSYNPQEPR